MAVGRHQREQSRTAIIAPLTGVRVLAATWVVLEHFRQPIFALLRPGAGCRSLISAGYLGVEVFFVLSGFIISHNYATRMKTWNRRANRDFIWLRFARLYPVHLVTFVGVAGLLLGASALHVALHVALNSPPRTTPISAVMNLALLQALPPAQAWNGPSWSMSCEAVVYLLFPLIALLLARATTRLRTLGGVVAGLAFTIAALALLSAAGVSSVTAYPAMWSRVLGEFVAGCFLWAYWQHFSTPRRAWDAVGIATVAAVAWAAWAIHDTTRLYLVALPLIALAILSIAGSRGSLCRALGSRVATYGGKISYSLYMTHFVVLMVVGKVLPWAHFTGSPLTTRIGVLSLYAVLVIVTAMAMYHAVEEPGRVFLRRVSQRSQPTPHGDGPTPPIPAQRGEPLRPVRGGSASAR